MTGSHSTPHDVSVCIANWNGSEVLPGLFRSLRELGDEASIEVIVVDNGSSDGSVQLIRERFPWVRLVTNQTNRGFARANNQAASAASGRFLFFLNNDTIVTPGAIDTLVGYLEANPGTAAVGARLVETDGATQPSCRRLPTLAAQLHRVRLLRWTGLFWRADRRCRLVRLGSDEILQVEQVAGAAMMIPRPVFDACKGWDEGFDFGVEDVDFCARLGAFGSIVYVGQAKVVHRGGPSSQANRKFVYSSYLCGFARYLRKRYGRGAVALYKPLVTVDVVFRILHDSLNMVLYRLTGQRVRARKRYRDVISACAFLCRDLGRFWRA